MADSGTQGHRPDRDLRDKIDRDPGDNLNDDALESEIELVSELVVAATSSDRRLHQEEVDLLLGIRPLAVQPQDQPKRPEM